MLPIQHDDILSPDIYADETTLHEMFARLRADEPVRWTTPSHYRPFWAISKYADIQSIEREPARFIASKRNRVMTIQEEARVAAQTGGKPLMHTLPTMDDPDHRKYRGITRAWFLPNNLKRLEPQIKLIVSEYLDQLEAGKDGIEFVNQIGLRIPLRVIMLILGIPKEDGERMHRLTGQLFSPLDPDTARESDGHAIAEAGQELFDYFKVLLRKRREAPQEDLASTIANAEIDGQPINEHEALSYCVTITAAGHETTASSISGGLHCFIEHPDQYTLLREQPMLLNSAVDEIFRYVSPVRNFIRTAVADQELRGQTIRAGDSVLMLYPSANRDEEVFDVPQSFRITRTKNPHIAFGFGPHMCLGHLLARMELKEFFSQFVQRVKHAELIGKPAWFRANFLGGLKDMRVRCAF